MYAQVVVLTYQPPDIDSYTYEIPKGLDVKVGQLVEVPFGKRNPMGIILSKDERLTTNAKKIKPITKILLDQPILLPYQIELLLWMSKYYIAPMVNCAEALLPKIPGAKARLLAQESASAKPGFLHSQSIILVPSINKIPETLAKFPKAKNYIVYHNEQKPSERFANWLKIAFGQADYVFSSRAGIFTPCPNLREIIIYNEHDSAYKDERSPYYDTLTIAQKIAKLTKAQLKIVDPCPKITTYFALSNHIKIQRFDQKVEIINMQNEKLSGRHLSISFDLEEEIRSTLEIKGNILLFLNKKKDAGHLFCKSCKTSTHLDKQPNECPNCQSPDIFWNVLNVNSLAQETNKLFANSKVNLVTNDRLSTIVDRQSQIDVGTTFTLYSPLVKKYDLVAHIQTDSLLNLADYTSGEKLFAQVTQLKKLLKDNGKLLLQTYNPEHPTISAIGVCKYDAFYKSELQQRKQLTYPPYSLLIKLTLKGKSEAKTKIDTDTLAKKLLTINDSRLTTLGPYKPLFWQRVPTYHIITKHQIPTYSLEDRMKAINNMSQYLEKGSKNYTIEVEPDGIQ